MEEEIRKAFELPQRDPAAYSPLALAYMGDGIYELVVRTILLKKGNSPANKLHKAAIKYVSAPAQAAIVKAIYNELTQQEKDIYTRGRNAKPKSTAKNASLGDYHAATGFEALMGYLYLTGQTERLLYLIRSGMEHDKEQGQ